MATLSEIEQALRAADAAGNREDAARLAQAYAEARNSADAADFAQQQREIQGNPGPVSQPVPNAAQLEQQRAYIYPPDVTKSGQLAPGNINLHNRPIVRNADGSISTVRTISIGTDKGEVVIPTVSDDGRIMSNPEAIDLYKRTGKNFGTFSSIDSATAFAKSLHDDQGREYLPRLPPKDSRQPSLLDRVVASPPGRLFHDAVLEPISGIAGLLNKLDPIGPDIGPVSQAGERAYQNALARNRNTPGYADARRLEDARLAAGGGTSLMDQVTAPFMPASAGVAGGLLNLSLDASNAAADAQTQGQENFRAESPVSSFLASSLGGVGLGAPPGLGGITSRLPRIVTIPRTPEMAAAEYVERLARSSGVDPNNLATMTGKPFTAAEAIGPNAEVALGA